jgi:hypothetical protein
MGYTTTAVSTNGISRVLTNAGFIKFNGEVGIKLATIAGTPANGWQTDVLVTNYTYSEGTAQAELMSRGYGTEFVGKYVSPIDGIHFEQFIVYGKKHYN